MQKGFFNFKIIGFLVFLIAGAVLFFGAESARADFDCLTLNSSSTSDQRAYCQNQVTQLENELKALNEQLTQQKNQSGTLSGDIKLLTTKINAKKTEIKAKAMRVTQLNESIGEKKTAIRSLSEKIENQKESLAQLLRKTNEMDQKTLTNFLLATDSLSSFYSDISRFDTLKSDVKDSVDNIKTIKGVTEIKKAELEKEQDKTLDEKNALQTIQKNIEKDQATQKQLLSISKNKETEYQKVIAQQQAKVAQIKAKLFSLAGGAQAIRFDVALQYAEAAQAKTGVAPAFVLAILTQESSLGKNVGQCFLTDTATGAGVGANTGKIFTNVMKPSRDVQPFIAITGRLGLDWKTTRVSCPIAGVAGYGGAMGPAQFIASTWKIFENRLKTALGHDANPWMAEDAFMASAMYLTDLGAVGNSYSAQIRAACKYYGSGGSTCSYGRSVMSLKASIESDIDYLKQYGVSRR
jgi:membrane-bound lytic murein transglycosylase B